MAARGTTPLQTETDKRADRHVRESSSRGPAAMPKPGAPPDRRPGPSALLSAGLAGDESRGYRSRSQHPGDASGQRKSACDIRRRSGAMSDDFGQTNHREFRGINNRLNAQSPANGAPRIHRTRLRRSDSVGEQRVWLRTYRQTLRRQKSGSALYLASV